MAQDGSASYIHSRASRILSVGVNIFFLNVIDFFVLFFGVNAMFWEPWFECF